LSVDVQMMWTMTIGSKCGMIGYMMPSPHFYQRRQLIVRLLVAVLSDFSCYTQMHTHSIVL